MRHFIKHAGELKLNWPFLFCGALRDLSKNLKDFCIQPSLPCSLILVLISDPVLSINFDYSVTNYLSTEIIY